MGADGGVIDAGACVPGPEQCNGSDEDCDGKIDEIPGCVSTWAGTTEWSSPGDGTGLNATFGGPTAMTVDGAGMIYVTDAIARRIRRIDPTSAEVVTVAGSGLYGADDGAALAATLVEPNGIAAAQTGALYFSDGSAGVIRRLEGAVVTTYAGGLYGWQDGVASQARFAEPWGIAVAADGRVFVADAQNHVIRRIDPGSPPVVTTIAGAPGQYGDADGEGTLARFRLPRGLWLDGATGVLLIADSANNKIRALATASNEVWTVAGLGALEEGYIDGRADTEAWFDFPSSVTMRSDGAIFVGDRYNYMIRIITSPKMAAAASNDGVVSTWLSNVGQAMGIVVAGDQLFASENYRARITRVSATTPGATTRTVFAGGGVIPVLDGPGLRASLAYPMEGSALSESELLVVDHLGCSIRHIAATPGMGPVVRTFAGDGRCRTFDILNDVVSVDRPRAVAPDGNGNVYISAEGSRVIIKRSSDGRLSIAAGLVDYYGYADGNALTEAKFRVPAGIAWDASTATLLIADENVNGIRRYDPATQTVTTFAGSSTWGYRDGAALQAHFATPRDVAVAPDGTTYVADDGNCAIRTIIGNQVATLAGGPAKCGYLDASSAAAALLGNVTSVVLSPDGSHLVFAEPFGYRVRAIELSTGRVFTVMGGGWGNEDGAVAQATLRVPWSAFFLPSGELVIIDRLSGQVRVLGSL